MPTTRNRFFIPSSYSRIVARELGLHEPDRFRRLLLSQPTGSVTEDDVDRDMFVSKRTLARRPEREGTGCRQVRNERRLSRILRDYFSGGTGAT
jgi:hypothetical protein